MYWHYTYLPVMYDLSPLVHSYVFGPWGHLILGTWVVMSALSVRGESDYTLFGEASTRTAVISCSCTN